MRNSKSEEQPTKELEEVQTSRGGKMIRWSRIWLPTAALFVLLCILAWLNEILDLPHVLLEAPRTPINWREAILEMGLVIAVALIVMSRLISGATRLEEKQEQLVRLEETQQRLGTAVEQAAEMVIITDAEGTILYVNPAFEQTTGYGCAEALGQNPRILKRGKQDATFCRELWQTLTAGGVWQGRLLNRKKDGSVYTEEETISAVRDQTGEIVNYVAIKHDVTRGAELEQQLRQAQKMEALRRLVGGIAHHLYTPPGRHSALHPDGAAAGTSRGASVGGHAAGPKGNRTGHRVDRSIAQLRPPGDCRASDAEPQ